MFFLESLRLRLNITSKKNFCYVNEVVKSSVNHTRGGGVLPENLGRGVGPLPKTLTLFMTKMGAKWLKSIPNL